jgi:hypothetical protein
MLLVGYVVSRSVSVLVRSVPVATHILGYNSTFSLSLFCFVSSCTIQNV